MKEEDLVITQRACPSRLSSSPPSFFSVLIPHREAGAEGRKWVKPPAWLGLLTLGLICSALCWWGAALSQGDSLRHGFTKFLQRGSLEMWFRSLGGNKHARCHGCLPVRQSNILGWLDGAIISTGPGRGTPAPPGPRATPRESLPGFMRPLSQSGHAQSQCPHHRWWTTQSSWEEKQH